MTEPRPEWPVPRAEEDWLTRTWKIVRWPLYAVALLAVLCTVFLYIAAVYAGS